MYKNILITIDIHGENKHIIQKGLDIAKDFGASTQIITAEESPVEPFKFSPGTSMINSELAIKQEIHPIIEKIEQDCGLAAGDITVHFGGRVSETILDAAEKMEADLIIMGTHGRHGLKRLLGSTANDVLHRSDRDVIAVKIAQ